MGAENVVNYEVETSADLRALENYRGTLQAALKLPQADAQRLTAELRKVDAALGTSAAQTVKLQEAMAKVHAARPGSGGLKDLLADLRGVSGQIPVVGTALGTLSGAAASRLGLAAAAVSALSVAFKQFSGEESSRATLLGFGLKKETIAADIKAVKDLAEATGGDLASATQLYLHAVNGQTRALKALGFVIDEAGSAAERLASIQSQAGARAMELEANRLETLPGKWDRYWKRQKEGLKIAADTIGIFKLTAAALDLLGGPQKEPSPIEKRVIAENKSLAEQLRLLDEVAKRHSASTSSEMKGAEARAERRKIDVDMLVAKGAISPEMGEARKKAIDSQLAAQRIEIEMAEARSQEDAARKALAALEKDRQAKQDSIKKLGPSASRADREALAGLTPQISAQGAALAAALAAQRELRLAQGNVNARDAVRKEENYQSGLAARPALPDLPQYAQTLAHLRALSQASHGTVKAIEDELARQTRLQEEVRRALEKNKSQNANRSSR